MVLLVIYCIKASMASSLATGHTDFSVANFGDQKMSFVNLAALTSKHTPSNTLYSTRIRTQKPCNTPNGRARTLLDAARPIILPLDKLIGLVHTSNWTLS